MGPVPRPPPAVAGPREGRALDGGAQGRARQGGGVPLRGPRLQAAGHDGGRAAVAAGLACHPAKQELREFREFYGQGSRNPEIPVRSSVVAAASWPQMTQIAQMVMPASASSAQSAASASE